MQKDRVFPRPHSKTFSSEGEKVLLRRGEKNPKLYTYEIKRIGI